MSKKDKVDAKNLTKFLQENTLLTEDHINEINNAINTHKEDKTEKVLSLGKLISLNWNIKNNISNKDIEEINRLFVELDFKIQRSDLSIENHSLSLSLPEFKVYYFAQFLLSHRNSYFK